MASTPFRLVVEAAGNRRQPHGVGRKSDSAGQLNRIVPKLCRFRRAGEAGMLTRPTP
jgi:hypothetical protein